MTPDETLAELNRLRDLVVRARPPVGATSSALDPDVRASLENFGDYMVLRAHDLRELQRSLARFGLTSLVGSEGNVLHTLEVAIARLREALAAGLGSPGGDDQSYRGWGPGQPRLKRSTERAFGVSQSGRHVRIMVTAPDGDQADETWMVAALSAGMDLLRINCAHGDRAEWAATIASLRRAESSCGKRARVMMDLAGPKLRTVELTPGPRVVRLKPRKDALGRVVSPARLAVSRAGCARRGVATAEIPDAMWARMNVGDELRLIDARGRSRALFIEELDGDHGVALASRTTYLVPETQLALDHATTTPCEWIAPIAGTQRVAVGGEFWLLTPGAVAPDGEVAFGCEVVELFGSAKVGHRILLDDGKVVGRIVRTGLDRLAIRVESAARGEARIRGEMGVNLPDTELPVPALSPEDLSDLEFVAEHADLVGLSFVRGPDDVAEFFAHTADVGRDLGVVLKIETRAGFEQLPATLQSVLGKRPVAVMIARGDLAVEVGWERLAEVQEEILWMCEAASVPVVWATQVLENMAKTGFPSRAEVTDAATAVRAECVMLNKGPHIVEAIAALDDILRRMESHTHKQRHLYRALAVSRAQVPR